MIDIKVPQTGSTFYGDEIISLKEMVSDIETETSICAGLYSIFGNINLSEELVSETINYCIDSVKNCSDLLEYERSTRRFLEQKGVLGNYEEFRKNRSATRAGMVKEYIIGKTVLDLGCGSGKIGSAMSNAGYEVTLADVYKNTALTHIDLPFHAIIDGQPLPFSDSSFDNILMLSMLHHTQNPSQLIDETKRILKKDGRLHLIETVYGIPPETATGIYGTDDSSFKLLSAEQQRRVTMFFDYFANHVLDAHTEDPDKYVPVPFNFTTPEGIEKMFSEKSFELISQKNLGVYPFSYVYHVHYVYEAKKI